MRRKTARRSSAIWRVTGLALVTILMSTISISPAVTGTPVPVAVGGAPVPATVTGANPITATVAPSTLRQTDAPDASSLPLRRTIMPTVSNIRVETGGDRTTIKLTSSAQVAIDAFALSAPYRVVIDMPEARFDFASPGRDSHGLVRSWRAGLFATGRSRIVFDLAGPVRISAARVDARDDGQSEITLDLQSISAEDFAADERARQQAKAAARNAAQASKGDREPVRTETGPRKLVVVLDPGHGGIDAGTVSPHTGMPEKQVVLEFARILEKKLTETGRYEVYMTRTTDTFIPLGERVKFARTHHADLLVSIHADAELDRSVRGSTIFTRSEKASDAAAAALAQKENQSDALAGIAVDDKSDDVADILIDLVKRETHSFSHALAETLVDAMSRTGHMVKQEPHRSAQLRVLNAYDFPSVLIELGFLSNKDDEAELVSPKWRDQTAISIVTAIDRFCASHDANAAP